MTESISESNGIQWEDVWTRSLSVIKSVEASSLGGITKPYLSSGVFTDDGELLLADYKNRRILLFDNGYSYVQKFKLDGNPMDIAKDNTTDQLFIALKEDGILVCTFQNSQLTIIRRITSPTATWGICFHGNTRVAGTDKCMRVLGLDGLDIRSMSKTGGDTYVALSASGQTIYHKDCNVIVGRRLDGVEVFRYSRPALVYPVGLGLDRQGNVYICGRESKNLHLVSGDGLRDRILLARLAGITKPYGIVVHPHRQEVVITSNKEDMAFEVYKF